MLRLSLRQPTAVPNARYIAVSALLFAPKTGKVVSWMAGRGYGFIEDHSERKQHFVHFSGLKVEPGGFRSLSVGQEVEFDVTEADGRPRAENVTGPGGNALPSGERPMQDAGGDRRGRGRGGGRGGGRGDGFRGRGDGERARTDMRTTSGDRVDDF
jgi:cold shock CspA family protein